MRTIAYVDAFNPYYGSLKGTPLKWLDLAAYFTTAFPNNSVHRVRYFTAKVKDRAADPQQSARQQAYLRALGTSPAVTVHYGHYLESRVWMKLVTPTPDGPENARVFKS